MEAAIIPDDSVLTSESCQLPSYTLIRNANSVKVLYAESRLTQWGRWARAESARLGYPKLSLIYKVLRRHDKRLGKLSGPLDLRLKGLTARGSQTRSFLPQVIGEVSPPIAEVDRVVARLPAKQAEVLRVEYLTAEDAVEVKAMLLGLYTRQYRRQLRRAKIAVAHRLAWTSY